MTLLTVISNVSLTLAPAESVAVAVTEIVQTSSLPGEDYNLVYNTVDGSFVFGTNTITGADPLFVNTIAGFEDLHLLPASPAIDAGTDLGVTDDKDQSPRPVGPAPDMGAYEMGPPPPVEVDLNFVGRSRMSTSQSRTCISSSVQAGLVCQSIPCTFSPAASISPRIAGGEPLALK